MVTNMEDTAQNHVVCMETAALLVSADTAATLLGISKRLFYSMHSSGKLGPLPIKFGSRSLWRRKELEAWVDGGCKERQQWEGEKGN